MRRELSDSFEYILRAPLEKNEFILITRRKLLVVLENKFDEEIADEIRSVLARIDLQLNKNK